jgi:anti-anti-sigma factor
MQTAIDIDGAVLVARPAGPQLDIGTAASFKSAVNAMISADGRLPDRVVIDLSEIEHVDSAGLGALISIMKRSRRSGVPLSLRNVCAEVMETLDLTLVSRVLDIERQEA